MKGFATLIGIPYEKEDCWGVAVRFYDLEMGMELKRYYDKAPNDREVANKLIYSSMGDFEKVTSPRFGDIVLINLYGIEAHIGIFINEQQLLHTQERTGCILDRMDKWKRLVVGYYRVKAND